MRQVQHRDFYLREAAEFLRLAAMYRQSFSDDRQTQEYAQEAYICARLAEVNILMAREMRDRP